MSIEDLLITEFKEYITDDNLNGLKQLWEEYQDKEIPASVVGEQVMQELQNLDGVAYVRFASVYREFRDVSDFLEELKDLLNVKKENGK